VFRLRWVFAVTFSGGVPFSVSIVGVLSCYREGADGLVM
jgi:hypothetical protein